MKTKTIYCINCNKKLIVPFKGKTKRCEDCARNERIRLSSLSNTKRKNKRLTEEKKAHLKVFMGIGEYADQLI